MTHKLMPGFLFITLGLASAASAAFAHSLPQAAATRDGDIIRQSLYTFPSYRAAQRNTDVARYATQAEYNAAVRDSRFHLYKLTYRSDGLKVIAYLYKPRQTKGQKYPVIIFNRGSAVRGDIAPELLSRFHRLAQAGFVIVAPLLRQSDGGEGYDEMGGAEVKDLMNAAALIHALPFADADNLFLYGESRGGMMTYQALRDGFPAKAAAVIGAFTDLQALFDEHAADPPERRLRPERLWPDYQTRKSEILTRRSALQWPEKINAPILILHGGADASVSPLQALRLAEKLQVLGKPYELLIYAGDNHLLFHNRHDGDRRVVLWFKTHSRK